MNKQGQYIQTTRGYKSFEPSHLPININLSSEMLNLLEQANISIGALSSLEDILPNPQLIIRPYAIREALLSSEIEGTQSTLSEVLGEEKETSENIDIREVQNYDKAIKYGIKKIKEEHFPLSLRLIKELHQVLMKDVRGGESIKTPGEFRTHQNWIGGSNLTNAVFIPCAPENLMNHLDNLEKYIYKEDLPTLIKAALIHYQFETIHPFNDGNGRIGRILITLQLINKGIINSPLLYLSLYFKKLKQKYYDLLTHVRMTGDYESWIIFFLNGILAVSNEVREKTKSILQLKEKIKISHKDPHHLIDLLFEKPIIRVYEVSNSLNVSLKTAYGIIKSFQDSGVIKEITNNKRNQKFMFTDYINLLNQSNLE